MTKHLLFAACNLAATALFCCQVSAQPNPKKETEVVLLPKLERVTVFTRGAQLTQSAKSSLKAGNNTIILDKIPTAADMNSLQIRLTNGVTLLETYQRTAPTPPFNSPTSFLELLPETLRTEYKKLEMEQRDLGYKSNKINLQQESFAQEKAHLEKYMNNLLTPLPATIPIGTQPTPLPEFKAELNAFRVKIDDIQNQLVATDRLEAETQERLAAVAVRMQEIQSRAVPPAMPEGWEQTRQQIVLVLNTEAATSSEIEVSYLIYEAGWIPSYDVRSKNAQNDLLMVYKAGIFQRSGLDWSNVNITVSSANAYVSNERPILYPQIIGIYQPVAMYKDNEYDDANRSQMGQNSYAATLESVVITSGADVARPRINAAMPAKAKREELKFAGGVATSTQTLLSVEYEIRLPQSIPNDGIPHTVIMHEATVNALYRYHSVPKLDKGAFLIAKVPEWGTLNLLTGAASLFLENKYVGKTTINPNTTADTLLLSLGRDEKINIKREKTECKTEHNLLKTKTTQTHTIEFTVLNNKNMAIDMELLDQLPISQNEEIEIELLEGNNAEYTKELGKLLWSIKLKPNESRKFKLKYTVKYPYGKTITGLQ